MGRPKKNENDKKIKIGITIDRELYNQIKKDKLMPSRIIEKLVKDSLNESDKVEVAIKLFALFASVPFVNK